METPIGDDEDSHLGDFIEDTNVESPVDARCVTIRVEDDGHGIPADVLPRIFEPHFSTRTSGSGLGLAISRRMVEAWGGTISVESGRGAGTVVIVTLASGAGG